MPNNKLIITWKPDVLTMVNHSETSYRITDDDYVNFEDKVGFTCRSHVDSFKNIKTKEAAIRILNKRNQLNIIVAKYNGEVLC